MIAAFDPSNDAAVVTAIVLLWCSLAVGACWFHWLAKHPSDHRSLRRAERERAALGRLGQRETERQWR